MQGNQLLEGLVVPVVTGLDETGRPDVAASRSLLDALARAGVTKLMVLGSNGEGPLLPTRGLDGYLTELIGEWRDRVPGGVAVVNATAAGTAEALERGAIAVAAGADAVVLCPPFYFFHRDDEIIEHYRRFADIGAPVIGYNIPRYVNPMTETVIAQLAGLDHVVGVKDSSGDLETLKLFLALKSERPDFGVSQGGETALLDGLRLGVDGIVPGTANIAPGLALQLLDAWRSGDVEAAERAQTLTTELTGIHRIRPGTPTVKAVLDLQGLMSPHVAAPLAACTEAERQALLDFIEPYREHLLGG
jgi:4-hydroxy-tetrahydrodipicolinate synthase